MTRRFTSSLTLLALLVFATVARAESGMPVAVRWWGHGMVSIETYWNQTVVFDPYPPNIGYDDPELSADLVLITHEHPDHNHPEAVQGDPTVVHGLDDRGQVKAITGVLDRLPNEAESTWTTDAGNGDHSGNAIEVSTVPAWHDNEQGGERGATTIFVVDVDGVRIVHCGDLGQEKLTDEQVKALGEVDVLLLPVGGIYTNDGAQAAEIVRQLKPRISIPIHCKTPALTFGLQNVDAFTSAIEGDAEVVRPKGNTLAVSATDEETTDMKAVVLGYEPWQPTGDLAELLTAMETACSNSQQVFAPLSAEQMNFRPSNGTHTPRWNVEHMAGVQLRLFSQTYAAHDSAIAPISMNPAQMPDDYEAAHPDWSGAEEARKIERVSDFVQRFSYLLDGVDLDEPAPGGRWSVRQMCGIMAGHYGEHTANVEKKFELDEWPSE